MTILILARLLALVAYAPVFLVPSIVVVSLGLWLGNIYIKAQLSIKRDMSNCKAPVLATFGSAIHGLGRVPVLQLYRSLTDRHFSINKSVRSPRRVQKAAPRPCKRVHSCGADVLALEPVRVP